VGKEEEEEEDEKKVMKKHIRKGQNAGRKHYHNSKNCIRFDILSAVLLKVGLLVYYTM
jgi:hypothetical protein